MGGEAARVSSGARIEQSFIIAGLGLTRQSISLVMRSAMDPRVTGRMNGAPNLPLPAEAYS
jgi:hypothetical protein